MRGLSEAGIEKLKQLAGGGVSVQDLIAAKELRPAQPPEERAAIIEAMFLMAAIDGEVSLDELSEFTSALQQILGTVTEADLDRLMVQHSERLAREGWDARIKAIGRSLAGKPGAESAFRLATAVAFVDDMVAHAESAALDAFSRTLHIPAERANEIMREVQSELFE